MSHAWQTAIRQSLRDWLLLLLNSLLQLQLWIWVGWFTLEEVPAWWYMDWKSSRMPPSEEGSVIEFTSHTTTKWTISLIFLAVTCSKLDDPEYGKVTVNGYGYSSTAYYSCNYGYELDGPYSRQCQHDGIWQGKAPVCRKINSKLFLLKKSSTVNNTKTIALCRELSRAWKPTIW